MPQHARYYWGRRNGTQRYNFTWDQIFHDSVVIVTASEGKPPSTHSPDRFIGDAGFIVMNIAPWDGGVSFGVRIEWDEPIGLWTDITVFDRTEPIYHPPSKFADD